jgi:hypothetical protein
MVASDKPRDGTGRRAWSGGDPRVEDSGGTASTSRTRTRLPRPAQHVESALDRLSAFDFAGSRRGAQPVTPPLASPVDASPVDASPVDASPVDDGAPTATLLARPAPPGPAPAPTPSSASVGPSAPPAPDVPASLATDAVPLTARRGTNTVTPPAARLGLGGRAATDGGGAAKTETVERVLEPLARLGPTSRPMAFQKSRRPRVRRVTRVVRHLDTWSVFKVALVFNLVLYVVGLTAGVLLWNVAYSTGTIDNIENFFEQFGWESFEFRGGELYHNLWVAGLFVAVGLTGLAVLIATLFNLITDLVGGVRVTVLEEEVVARAGSRVREAASRVRASSASTDGNRLVDAAR